MAEIVDETLRPAHIAGMGAEIFDRKLLRTRRARAAIAGLEPDYLIERMAGDLALRLSAVTRDFPLALALGGGASFTSALGASGARAKIGTLVSGEFAAGPLRQTPPAVVCDEELLPIAPASLDLIASLGVLQWTNDLPGALAQARTALKPDGLFLAALVGGTSLTELRQSFLEAEAELEGGASPRVAPMVDVRDLGHLLQSAGFALPVIDIDRVTVSFATPLDLMRDLRAMGATNILRERKRAPLRRATLMRTLAIYTERFAGADGRITATFEILHAAGWAPAPTQPRALKPGSAVKRLADALGAVEHGPQGPRRA
jgi:SAM-dependent methyltransferase